MHDSNEDSLVASSATSAPFVAGGLWQQHSPSGGKTGPLFFAALLLIFILAVGMRWYGMAHKTFVHLDESTSIVLSTCNATGWDKHFEDGVLYTGQDMRRLAYAVAPGLPALARDLFLLRMDSRDPPHSNLFYSFYRIALTGAESWDTQTLLWRGTMLNLLFFSLSFGLLWWLAHLIFAGDRSLILLGLLAAAMNPAALSNSLFVRPYQLQEMLFIALTLMTVWYVLRIRTGQPCPGYALFFGHALTLGLSLLSGYFIFFYVPLLGLVLLGQSLLQQQKAYIPYFLLLTLLGALLAWALYASFMVALFIDRGVEASEKISLHYLASNAAHILDKFIYLYGKHALGIGGAVLLVCAVLSSLWARPGRKAQSALGCVCRGAQPLTGLSLLLLLACLLWSLTVFALAPYKTLRYFMPAVPLTLLLACTLFQCAPHRRILMPLFALCLLSLHLVPGSVEYYQEPLPPPLHESVYVASFTEAWRPLSFLPHIGDKQQVIFYRNCETLRAQLAAPKHSTLLVDARQFQHCRLDEMGNLHKEQDAPYFSVYSTGAMPPAKDQAP